MVMVPVSSYVESDLLAEYIEPVKKVVSQILSGETLSAGVDKKDTQLWTVKLNDKWRLFFTYVLVPGEEPLISLIEIMLNHKYKLALAKAKRTRDAIHSCSLDSLKVIYLDLDIKENVADIKNNVEHKSNEFTFEPAYLHGDTIIQFSEDQQTIIHSNQTFICTGEAGTGKSLSALYLMKQLVEQRSEDTKPIVFFSQTKQLVNKMQQDWQSQGFDERFVRFMSDEDIDQFYPASTLPRVNAEDFEIFFKERVRSTKSNQGKKKKSSASSNVFSLFDELMKACKFPEDVTAPQKKEEYLLTALYQELCMIAYYGKYADDKNVYVSAKHSYFLINDSEYPMLKQRMIDVLEQYREFINDSKFDDALSVFPRWEGDKPFSVMLSDEAQNIPLSKQAYLLQLSDQSGLFMDDTQGVQFAKASFSHKVKLVEFVTGQPIVTHELKASYRCSVAVRRVADGIVRLRDELAGISPQIPKESANKTQGSAELLTYQENGDLSAIVANVNQQLSQYNAAKVMIITSLQVGRVQKLFPNHVVLNPSELPGLDDQHIVLFQPLGETRDNNVYVAANDSLKLNEVSGFQAQKEVVASNYKQAHTANPRHTQAMQLLYMIVTRAIENLIIVQKNYPGIEVLLDKISTIFKKAVEANSFEKEVEPVNPATEADWEEKYTHMMLSGSVRLERIQFFVERDLYQNIDKNKRFAHFKNKCLPEGQRIASNTPANIDYVKQYVKNVVVIIENISSASLGENHDQRKRFESFDASIFSGFNAKNKKNIILAMYKIFDIDDEDALLFFTQLYQANELFFLALLDRPDFQEIIVRCIKKDKKNRLLECMCILSCNAVIAEKLFSSKDFMDVSIEKLFHQPTIDGNKQCCLFVQMSEDYQEIFLPKLSEMLAKESCSLEFKAKAGEIVFSNLLNKNNQQQGSVIERLFSIDSSLLLNILHMLPQAIKNNEHKLKNLLLSNNAAFLEKLSKTGVGTRIFDCLLTGELPVEKRAIFDYLYNQNEDAAISFCRHNSQFLYQYIAGRYLNTADIGFLRAVAWGHFPLAKDLRSKLKNFPRINNAPASDHIPILIRMVSYGCADMVELLVSIPEINVDVVDNFDRTACYYAAKIGLSGILRILIKAGADVNKKLNYEKMRKLIENEEEQVAATPLQIASVNNNEEAVRELLLCENIDVNAIDNYSHTALNMAVYIGYLPIIITLLQDKRVDVNHLTNDGEAPLHFAASNAVYLPIVQELLKDKRIDVNAPRSCGATPLDIAINICGDLSMVQAFLAHPDIDIYGEKDAEIPLKTAVSHGDVSIVQALLSHHDAEGYIQIIQTQRDNAFVFLAEQWGYFDIANLLRSYYRGQDLLKETSISTARVYDGKSSTPTLFQPDDSMDRYKWRYAWR